VAPGRGLPGVYLAALEEEGTLVRESRRRWGVFPAGRLVLAGTPDRRRAALHWSPTTRCCSRSPP